jgi:hypothetical protein
VLAGAAEMLERAGLPVDAVKALEDKLTAMTDGELLVHVTRSLLINAALLMEQAKEAAPELMRADSRGLAALYLAAHHMTEGAHDLMREARNLGERALKEKGLLLIDQGGNRTPSERSPNAQRSLSARSAFAGLIEKFGSIQASADADADGDRIDRPGPSKLPPRTIN